MVKPDIPEGFNFTDPELYEHRLPLEEFAELRRTAPVWWNAKRRGLDAFDDEGYWVVTRHDEIKEISRKSDVYSSRENTAIIQFPETFTRDQIDAQQLILLNMDPPEHTKVRGIISRGFTPRAMNRIRDALDARAKDIAAKARAKGTGDFVEDVACELPLQAIAELLGVPQEDRGKLFEWSNKMVGYDDPEYEEDPAEVSTELVGYAMGMAEERKQCPMDDIVTKLVNADVDGEGLTSDEFGFFVVLLSVAGNETTRNAISHGMKAFMDNPDQWEKFKAERPSTAADEIVRWGTPVMVFQRTALQDTELDGVPIKQGQRVGMFYSSANFDPEAFDEPEKFDIMRSPNPHLGFGGNGVHYCVGANLAKMEIDLIFNAIADHMPDIHQTGELSRMRSAWLNGIKTFPVAYA